ELRPRDSDRDRESYLLPYGPPERGCDLDRRTADVAQTADVEERLIDRECLDDRRGLLKDLEHRLARLAVCGEARRDDDRLGAQTARLGLSHRSPHAACLRLVARREHHSAPDEHRPAAEPRIVSLLYRCVEGIEVS